MDEKINADLKSLEFVIKKNKSYIVSIVIVLISILLFFQFIIPQFNSLLAVQKEAKDSSLRLDSLKANLDVLTNINEETLDSQLNILNSALPLGKNFVGILNSIYSSAQKTGVSLGNFSLKIGDITQTESGNFLFIRLSLPVNSSVAGANSFIETITKSLPLVEINSVKAGGTSSTITLSFYYKPLGGAANYSQDARISSVSQKGLTIINQLSKFDNAFSVSQVPVAPVATPSASQ